MSISKLLMILVGLGVFIGLILAATGVLKMDKEGNVTFSQEQMDAATTASDMSKGIVAMGQTKYVEAINHFNNYINKNPKADDVPDARFRIAKCYEANGEQGQAIRWFKSYLADFPNDSVDRRNQAKTRIDTLENSGYKEAK